MAARLDGSVLISHTYGHIHVGSHSLVHNGNIYGPVTNNISTCNTCNNNNRGYRDLGSDRIDAAACIAGLRTKISSLCNRFTENITLWKHDLAGQVYYNTDGCRNALEQLQAYLYGNTVARNRRGLISLQDFLTALTAAVLLFEEVQELLPTLQESWLEEREVSYIVGVLEKLQWQESAWSLMTRVLDCPFERQAEATGLLLANVVTQRLSTDVQLAGRLEALQDEMSDLTDHLHSIAGAERLYVSVLPGASASSGAHLSVAPYAFETDLLDSRVYRRYHDVSDDSVDHSRKSIQTARQSAVTRYTNLTLEGSILTVIAIPIYLSQLRDATVYRSDAQDDKAVIPSWRADNTQRAHPSTLQVDFRTSSDSFTDACESHKGPSQAITILIEEDLGADKIYDTSELCRGYGTNEMLFYASEKQVLKSLVERGALLEHRDSLGRTPLMWHAREGQDDMVEALLELGALVDEVNIQHRRTALFYASNAACVIHLAQRGANLAAKDVHGMTPLSCHVQCGREATASALIACGATVEDMHPKTNRTALFYAQSEECVKLLISHGSLVDHRDIAGNTPFLWHVHEGRRHIVRQLILHGACDNTFNAVSGESALGIALRRGHKHVAQLILSSLGSGA